MSSDFYLGVFLGFCSAIGLVHAALHWPQSRSTRIGHDAPDWRRSFNHENVNRPTGDPPLRFRRSKR